MKSFADDLPGAVATVRAIAEGRLTAEGALRARLERCAAVEAEVGAWVHLDEDGSLAQARALDTGPMRGPLHGVALGIKDIFAVRDMPWRCGSPIWADRTAQFDAAPVALARRAGAVILGKTETTEFAGYQPSRTRNPVVPGATPGGSSAGSAAAVASGMVPLALGTQTSGSIIRPASYCGVVGYKPSFDLVDTWGVSVFARSFDTVGAFARSVPDAALAIEALSGLALQPGSIKIVPRLLILRGPTWEMGTSELHMVWQDFEASVPVTEAGPFNDMLREAMCGIPALHARIMAVEASEALAYEFEVGAAQISDKLRSQIEEGAAQTATQRLSDRAAMLDFRQRMLAATQPGDVWMTPAATGAAPVFESGTGDPAFSRIWSLLGFPCCTVPVLEDSAGRPIGVQVVARQGEDALVLEMADRLMREKFRDGAI
ncbi:amidase [Thioclava sp.]|uniref:amidase n=1 Tax=Thioclava sp. TaxID=1933450 RepID=UPI003AA95DBE